ncbi:unnamed protein product [Spirodela intermedia]|uniref:Late embryogenesis abundant protein LEA-2 subgroup domain-containing protein n=1 Tax=Spirodela intermedia TaxID=51605 RepID=A0A7I8IUJ2_SPIIN|nr:unnamed protein product [Spirodela intermedia]CAA6661439.1 unnamed protein product [Spirodela intermedia]
MAKAGEVDDDTKTGQEALLLPRNDDRRTLPYYGVPIAEYSEDLPPLSPRPYLLIPLHHGCLRRRGLRRRCFSCVDALLFSTLHTLLLTGIVVGLTAFLLWPSEPELRLARLKLRSLRITTKHKGTLVALDVAMDLKIRVQNRAFFSLDYDNVTVGIEYRGRPLGSVVAGGGVVEARGVSFVAATLRLDGIRVLEDALFLIEDLVKGKIPSTLSPCSPATSASTPSKSPSRISCAVIVDVENQAIASQDCYPE